MQTENSTEDSKRSRVGTYLRWTPVIIILLVAFVLLGMMLVGGLTKLTAWYLMQLILPLAGLITLIALSIVLFRRKQLDTVLVIGMTVAILALCPSGLLIIPVPFPSSLDSMTPSATVRLPADVPLTTIWGGDKLSTNYHASTPDQRWAYDFVIPPFFTGSENLTDYGCYGTPVVAPVSGPIHEAHDGEPDSIPGKPPNDIASPLGNHVVIELETGTYLVIAHLKPGSLTVKTGDVVEEGQVIGLCGNSGNTNEPHIHIHHQRQDPALYPVGYAEGLPLYFRDLDGPAMPVGGYELVDGTPVPIGDVVTYTGK